MEIIDEIKVVLPGFARAFPIISGFSSLMFTIYSGKPQGIILALGLIANDILNDFIKRNIAKPLIGNKKLPIIGTGKRPVGAKNTAIFLSEDIKEQKKLSKSYGMPSGHSQNAWFFTSYLFMLILNNENYKYKIPSLIFLPLLSSYISYSRVFLNCHTVQQVIIGGIIGSILGSGFYFFTKNS